MNERLADQPIDSPATDLSTKDAVIGSFGIGLTSGLYAEIAYFTKAVVSGSEFDSVLPNSFSIGKDVSLGMLGGVLGLSFYGRSTRRADELAAEGKSIRALLKSLQATAEMAAGSGLSGAYTGWVVNGAHGAAIGAAIGAGTGGVLTAIGEFLGKRVKSLDQDEQVAPNASVILPSE